MTLGEIAIGLTKIFKGIEILNTFARRHKTQTVAEIDDRSDDCSGFLRAQRCHDKPPVKLHFRKRQTNQLLHGRETSAKIIN